MNWASIFTERPAVNMEQLNRNNWLDLSLNTARSKWGYLVPGDPSRWQRARTLPKGPFTPSESMCESENFLWCLNFFLWSLPVVLWSFSLSRSLSLSFGMNKPLGCVHIEPSRNRSETFLWCLPSIMLFATWEKVFDYLFEKSIVRDSFWRRRRFCIRIHNRLVWTSPCNGHCCAGSA